MKKFLKNNIKYITIILLFIIIYFVIRKKENFARSVRYMYMYNPTSKNSSYDQRGEPIFHIKDISKTGAYYESSYDDNQTNQRVKKYYQKYQMDTPKKNSQFNILAYSKM